MAARRSAGRLNQTATVVICVNSGDTGMNANHLGVIADKQYEDI